MDAPHRVVIVGGGFGGLYTARHLRRAPVEVTLLDRRNFHLFQPLLYQVATGGLSPANIASPLRAVLRRQKNTRVLLAEVVDLDADRKRVTPRGGSGFPNHPWLVATGARNNFFAPDEGARCPRGLKSI